MSLPTFRCVRKMARGRQGVHRREVRCWAEKGGPSEIIGERGDRAHPCLEVLFVKTFDEVVASLQLNRRVMLAGVLLD